MQTENGKQQIFLEWLKIPQKSNKKSFTFFEHYMDTAKLFHCSIFITGSKVASMLESGNFSAGNQDRAPFVKLLPRGTFLVYGR